MPAEPSPALASTDRLGVDVALTADDLVAFNTHIMEQRPTARATRWALRLLIPIAAVALLVVISLSLSLAGRLGETSLTTVGIVLGGIFAIITVINWRSYEYSLKWDARQLYRGNPMLSGLHRIEITPEWLIRKDPISETRILWSAVQRIETTPDLFLIFFGSVSAYIIPRRAFPDAESFERFADGARRWAAAAPEP